MSHSYAIEHAPGGTTESVLIEVSEKADFSLTFGPAPDPLNKNAIISIYTLANGDQTYPATVTYRVEAIKRDGKLVRRLSMTYDTWATDTDSVTGDVAREPISMTWSANVPTTFSVEVADFDDMLGNFFNFLYASQSSGARATTYISKLLFGASKVV
jgi:hypothetical protein